MKQVSLESQAQELDFDTVGTRASTRQQVADAMREKKTILGFVISTHGFSLINARCSVFFSEHVGISIIADCTTIK